jgi:hypothetical protein
MIAFESHAARVEMHLRSSYGVRVVTRDIPDPLLGDLDGAEIHVDHLLNAEMRLFLLAHLFGHTVQWNVHPNAVEIGQARTPPVDEALMPAILEYEREAASYALGMFHEIGITDADQWLSDFTACDIAYLEHYYRSGEKLDPMRFWRDGTPLIAPREVPRFTPVRRVFRRDGIVI